MWLKPTTNKLVTFLCLYIAQSIPMSFFSTVIPVMMRQENFSLSAIGLLQLIKLPWIIKFFWSPLVDRNCMTVSHYKRWIFSSELIYAVLIFSVAFLDFKENFSTILILVIISFVASATQDIATDALAVLSFSRKDKSLVNSMQSMGSFAGAMIGGGVLLLLFKQIGWNSLLPCLAIFVIVALVPLFFNKDIAIKEKSQAQKAKKTDFYYFFTQKGIWKQIIFLFLYYSGLIGTLAMLKPYMVDLGYNIKEIGVMSGLAGTFIAFLSSFGGGFIIRRIGRYRARILFAVAILLATFYFLGLSYVTPTTLLLYIGIFLLWGSYGMATIIVYTTAMDCVREGREGTDFTIQTVITHLSSMCIAIASGKIADLTGYHGLFLFEVILATVSLIYIIFVFKKKQTL
ncbi:MAG: MFS transporter [Tannerellaceae bacterium]|nr:MFS transporter [uncultured Macellibacteroides sp.]MBN2661223.1 MFS transporter [Tannerellaceae bacterium]MBP7486688.1 MFS transporter [Parabacteroides sp.]MBP8758525.1 MFS transporter [Parabacteroides sp.]MBP9481474.1 MFS transporter [Parabacteroides sp.]MBP9579442.1 MFS transporter [Parabacteroides sp.]